MVFVIGKTGLDLESTIQTHSNAGSIRPEQAVAADGHMLMAKTGADISLNARLPTRYTAWLEASPGRSG